MRSVETVRMRSAPAPSIFLGAACLMLHLIINNRYGVFRDELYFIVCGQHPAFGYVDQPPLVPWIAGASHAVFGVWLLPLRLAPALCMSATVMLATEFARALGGGRFAQWLCGLAVLLSPIFLVDGLLLVTDFMQPLTWLAVAWCLLRLAETNDERWWLGVGLSVGISLTSKYLIFFYLAGLAVGALATPFRHSLGKPYLYFGGVIAFVFLAPSLAWQAQNDWPFLEIGRAGAGGKNLALSPLGFLGQQFLFVGPGSAPIWLAGLWRFAFRPSLPQLRVFPIAYAVTALLVYLAHGKAYYLTPIYPVLLAGGAVAIEEWLRMPWVRGLAAGGVAIAGILVAPLALPILPPADYSAYAGTFGLSAASSATETNVRSTLPQQLADMFGWREMAQRVSAVYNALPADERAKAVFFGRNYGEAAALDVYGPAFGGPPAISGHNNYYLWGTRGYDGSVVLTVGGDPAQYAKYFESVQRAGELDAPFAVSYESHIPIYVLRSSRIPLAKHWPGLKHYE
jgi:hypothetical protein